MSHTEVALIAAGVAFVFQFLRERADIRKEHNEEEKDERH